MSEKQNDHGRAVGVVRGGRMHGVVATVFIFLCAACSPKAYRHAATGFTFPGTVGAFQRVNVTPYNSEATDIGVGYDNLSAEERMATTVFVYPAPHIGASAAVAEEKPKKCKEEFEVIKSDIVRARNGARPTGEGSIESPSPAFRERGLKATFSFTGIFAQKTQPLISEAELYCYVGGDWFVAYRTTAPAGEAYQQSLWRFMHALTWPAR